MRVGAIRASPFFLIDILVNSIYLSDEEDGTQKMTVLLNTQNGQETVTLNDLTQCSSNVHMVHHQWAR